MSETLSDIPEQSIYHYKLRININGFNIKDINVSLVKTDKNKIQVKINAIRNYTLNNQETRKEYSKLYDVSSKYNVDPSTMRYYLDPKNSLYLIVEFESSANENFYVNLDDSCESLVEMAAKSLLNIKNIEDLRNAIENPFNPNLDPKLEDIFSSSLIRDLNIATRTTFTPIKIIENQNDNTKFVRVNLTIPNSVTSASVINKDDIKNENDYTNHIKIKFDGLKLNLEALTKSDNSTSMFSKQFNLPKGTQTSKTDLIKFNLDNVKHSLIIEAPYSLE